MNDSVNGYALALMNCVFSTSQVKKSRRSTIGWVEAGRICVSVDSEMTLEPMIMIKRTSANGRATIAALHRLKPFLDSSILETMYNAFVRSSLECGNLHYMVAAPTHLQKLDRMQATAERLGNFKVESPQTRRDAPLIGLIFKLIDGGMSSNQHLDKSTQRNCHKVCC